MHHQGAFGGDEDDDDDDDDEDEEDLDPDEEDFDEEDDEEEEEGTEGVRMLLCSFMTVDKPPNNCSQLQVNTSEASEQAVLITNHQCSMQLLWKA